MQWNNAKVISAFEVPHGQRKHKLAHKRAVGEAQNLALPRNSNKNTREAMLLEDAPATNIITKTIGAKELHETHKRTKMEQNGPKMYNCATGLTACHQMVREARLGSAGDYHNTTSRGKHRTEHSRWNEPNTNLKAKQGSNPSRWKQQQKETRNPAKQSQKNTYSSVTKLATWDCRRAIRETQRDQITELTTNKNINVLAVAETHMNMYCIEGKDSSCFIHNTSVSGLTRPRTKKHEQQEQTRPKQNAKAGPAMPAAAAAIAVAGGGALTTALTHQPRAPFPAPAFGSLIRPFLDPPSEEQGEAVEDGEQTKARTEDDEREEAVGEKHAAKTPQHTPTLQAGNAAESPS